MKTVLSAITLLSMVSGLGLAVVVLAPVKASAGPAQDVIGTWKLGVLERASLTIEMKARIDSASVTSVSVCSIDGKSITTEATGAAIVSDTQIKVIASAEKAVQGDINCDAKIDASTLNYVLSADGKNLTVMIDGTTIEAVRDGQQVAPPQAIQ